MRRLRPALLPSSTLVTPTLLRPAFSTLILCGPILCILLFSSRSFAEAPDRIAGPIDSSQTVALPKSHPPKAQPKYDLGPVDPSFKLDYVTLFMAPSASQQQALDQLMAQQQDRTSPNYHQWLTPQQYADRFGLSHNDLSKITSWLTSEGFQIVKIGGSRNTVIISGNAAQAQLAFGTEIHNYEVDGVKHFANSTPVLVPAALDGIVASVMGLHNFRALPAYSGKRSGAVRRARPDYYDGNFVFPNFLAPGDIYTIYDIIGFHNAGYDGAGQTLAIVGQTDVYLDDLNDFRSGFGLTPINTSDCATNGSGVIVSPCNDPLFSYVLNGPDEGVNPQGDDLGEADLDLEWSGATARSAQIIYVNSGGTSGGVYDALTAVIDPPSGPPLSLVVSMSYGYCESFFAGSLETLLQAGVVEGVTILNSSGDQSSAACDFSPPGTTNTFSPNPPFLGAQYGLGVSYPASSPNVTGVGGTEISLANDSYPSQSSYWSTTLGANGGTATGPIPEIAWNDIEEFANYCHAPASGDTFCSTGGGTPGWVALTTSATAHQVQNDIWIDGGGGGASNCFYVTGYESNGEGVCQGPGAGPSGGGLAQPSYQQGLDVTGAPSGVRYVPDVSLLASPDFPGHIWCTQLSELGVSGSGSSCASGIFTAVDTYESWVGGTSASAPVFAGIVTLLNDYLVSKGVQSQPGLGNINYTLYELAASNSTNHAFNQVTTGDNMVYCQAGLPEESEGFPSNMVCPAGGVFGYMASNRDTKKGTGYNLVTGLGSVDAYKLAQAWAAIVGASTSTALTSSQNPAIQGASVTFTATVTTTGADQPTGTVTFNNGTTEIGSGTLATVGGAQVATLSTSDLPVGTDSITAVYGGDSNNAGSTSATLTQTITAVTTTTTVTSSQNPANYGIAVTFTATVTTSGSIKPTGDVTFYNGTTSLGTGTLGTSGGAKVAMAAFTTSAPLPAGMDSITAVYAGDSNNSGSTSAVLTETISPPTFTLSTPTTPAPVLAGVAATSTFTATPTGGAAFAGSVTFSCAFAPADPTLTNSSCVFNPAQIAAGSGATPVTLSISTAGPNAASGSQLRRRADNRSRSPWLPLSLPVAGAVMLGLMRGKVSRKAPKHSAIALICFSLLLLGFMMACGGGGSSTTPPPASVVTVSPSSVRLYADEAGNAWAATATQQQFSASVSNSSSQTVTWGVTGTSANGTISSTGLFASPATVPSPAAVTVTATSAAATTPGTGTVTILTPTGDGQLPATYTVTVTATESTTVHTQPVTLIVQ